MNPIEFDQKPLEPSKLDVIKNLVFILVTIGVAYYITVSIGINNLREIALSTGVWGPLAIILLKATTIVVAPLGGTPIYVVSGAIFGFWQGLTWTLLGDLLGGTIAFYLSRIFGRTILQFFIGRGQSPLVNKLLSGGIGMRSLIKARFFFLGFPEAFAYAFGLTAVSYPIFIMVHMGGNLISNPLLVAFGGLIVSGDTMVFITLGVVSLLLAYFGVRWFKIDLLKGN